MELPNIVFACNRDWDPSYLSEIFNQDFYEFKDHWESNVCDDELVQESNRVEHYCPITQDISLDDELLCQAVEKVEEE